MYNDKPCTSCDYFDPILKGKQSKRVETVWGWCAKKSVYPYQEGPGQKFPEGVTRLSEPGLAKPVIVKVGQVIEHCRDFKARRVKQSKIALLEAMKNL